MEALEELFRKVNDDSGHMQNQQIEVYKEVLERHKEYFTSKCSLVGRSKYFSKIFSIAFFYKANTKKSTKFFAYIAGIIESIANVENIINKDRSGDNRYGVHVYINQRLLETAELSPITLYTPLSYEEDSVYDMINKLILFLKDREIVNVIVYDCGKYTDKGLFGTVTRFFPFFTDYLEEIHVRDTDSSFGNEFDLACIKQWKNSHKDYYYYASYDPKHITNWASKYNIEKKNYKGIIANSFGGKIIKVENVETFFAENVFGVCDVNCEYGIDEVVLGFYMYKYMEKSLYHAGVRLNIYNIYDTACALTEHLACYTFANLCGISSYFTNYFTDRNNDTYLNTNEMEIIILCYYLLVANFLSAPYFKYFAKLSVIPLKLLQKYNRNLSIETVFRIIKYLIDKFGNQIHIDLLNNCFNKAISNVLLGIINKQANFQSKSEILDIISHSMQFVTPNPLMYSMYFLSEYDRNVQSSTESQKHDGRYLSYITLDGDMLGVVGTIGSDSFIGEIVGQSDKMVYKFRSYMPLGLGVGVLRKYTMLPKSSLLYLQGLLNNELYKINFQQLIAIHDIQKHKSNETEKVPIESFYVAYQYVEGVTIDEFISSKNITADMIEIVFAALIKLCNYLHGNGWVHGDINEGNIIIDENGNVVLIDFDKAVPSTTVKMTGKYIFPYTNSEVYAVGGYVQALTGYDERSMNVAYDLFCIAETIRTMIKSYNFVNNIPYQNQLYLKTIDYLSDVNNIMNDIDAAKIELLKRFS